MGVAFPSLLPYSIFLNQVSDPAHYEQKKLHKDMNKGMNKQAVTLQSVPYIPYI